MFLSRLESQAGSSVRVGKVSAPNAPSSMARPRSCGGAAVNGYRLILPEATAGDAHRGLPRPENVRRARFAG
jgi:hypothetical protein